MARIPNDELERLKAEVSVQRLAEARGVKLKAHGKDLIGLCPFHDDREPSLVISPQKNLWHCLGACQAGGTCIDWVMRADGVSFRHAVERLRGSADPKASPEQLGKRAPLALDPATEDQALLHQVLDYYHETLKQSPEALAYLEKRGLMHPELLSHFKLGYANRTLGYSLPPKSVKAGQLIRGRLQELGILRETGHEHFNGSLVIPVMDAEGRVTEIYGRKISDDLPDRCPRHLYLKGPHQGVFNVQALSATREVILCESLIDALTFWCAGYRHVTSSYGIEGFTAEHLEAFRRHRIERVLIAYDRDEAGERAAKALAEKLMAEGFDCYRVHFPKGMDANEYALDVKPAERSLALVLRSASWMGNGSPPEARSEASVSPAPPQTPPPAAPTPTEPPPSLVATPKPPAPVPEIAAEVSAEEVVLWIGDRRYRVRGLDKNLSYEQLKVNVLAANPQGFHVDTLDLYSARHRGAYVREAAHELKVKEDAVKKDLGQVLLKLEALQHERIQAALAPKPKVAVLSEEERAEALSLLQDSALIERILSDFEACGVIGEETNKLLGYLACVSRKLEQPLAVIIQSSSAAGKSSLMEALLAFVPEEDRVKYSAMTGQSLFYMGEEDLKHRVLAIVEEEGAQRASYALKLLQSEGELTIASTGKDPNSGRLITHEYRVEGPVAILLTTTAIDLDEELLNRCLVLTVDEERGQTQAIHQLQRERQTLDGLLARRERQKLMKLHQNAQRLLEPLLVANPYARRLTFLDTKTRTRRDHMKYLTLIRTIALLHQHQRPKQTAVHQGQELVYIEATPEDIRLANRLANEALGRSLDELPPQTRNVLAKLDRMVAEACQRLEMERQDYRFSRRDVRQYTGLGNTQLKLHLDRLTELEYLVVHRGGRGQSFVYELVYRGEGQEGGPFLTGLIDPDALGYDGKFSGVSAGLSGERPELAGPNRPQIGPKSARFRGGQNGGNPSNGAAPRDSNGKAAEKARIRSTEDAPSHQRSASALAAPARSS